MAAAAPQVEDLEAMLADAGITPPSQPRLASALAAAVRHWETETGWAPFGPVVQTRYYDPPGPHSMMSLWSIEGSGNVLDLGAGVLSVTSVLIGSNPYTQVPAGGDWTTGNFWLTPVNAPLLHRPYEGIRFAGRVWGPPQSIAVSGTFGFATVYPDDAFEAVLAAAAYRLIPVIASARSTGLAKRSTGEKSEQYAIAHDAGAYAYEAGLWAEQRDEGIARYKRSFF